MARNQKHYDTDYKVQSVNLAKEIGLSKAARELGISPSTLNGWIKATREGRLTVAPAHKLQKRQCLLPMNLQCFANRLRISAKRINALKKKMNFLKRQVLFCGEPSEVSKESRLKFIARKTEDGRIKGKLSLYCKVLNVSRQAFYKYLERKDLPWKYDYIVNSMYEILNENQYNDTYVRYRMFAALKLKHQDDPDFHIPGERTVYRIMKAVGLVHRPKRNPKGITKADRNARKSDDKLKRNFKSDKPLEKCVTDITEIKGKDAKLYVSAIFDCFDVTVLGLAMDTNMKAQLCVATLNNAYTSHPEISGCICHSDRGTQYTSQLYRDRINELGIIQSMNSDGGRCHDNARCENMWARLKDELFYSRNLKSTDFTVAQLKKMVWRYFMSYWNNRRICSSNDGLPPKVKRDRYYAALPMAA